MSEKNLSEAEWKKFSKGHDWKDAAFVKALAALDKAKAPDQELDALDNIDKQADALRKSAKGDKELAGYLDDLDKSLGKQRKLSEAEVKKAAKDQGGDDEEEETPALLTSKMIPLIRQVKKGEEMQALLANNGKEVAVMLSRRPISPSKRKLMAEYLDGGTPKYYPGTCIFEENAYTFVLKTQAGGLAKKLKAALLKQVELRLKVRVRGEDPNDVDDDGEAAEDESGEGGEGLGDKKPQAESRQQPAAIPQAPPLPPDPLKAQYDKRMETMEPRVLAVLKAQTGDASKIRAVAEFVREKGDSQNYKAALAGMESLEKLLAAAGNVAAPTANPATAIADPGAAAFNARLAALMPQVKEAIAAATDASQDVKLKVSEAGVFARKKDFERANALLDDAEELIEAVLNPDARKTGEAEDGKAEDEDSGGKLSEYEVLRARLESDYEIATRSTNPALADQQGAVRRAWEMATDSFEADDPARALLILKRLADGGALERLLEASRAAASGTAKSGPSLVAQRKFMLEEWSKMPGLLRGKLQALRSTLVSSEADEDPDGLVDGIEDALEEMLDEIKDTMDQAINDGDTAVFKGLRDRARSNGLMQHLMAAPDFDGGALLESVEGTLERIERAMVAA